VRTALFSLEFGPHHTTAAAATGPSGRREGRDPRGRAHAVRGRSLFDSTVGGDSRRQLALGSGNRSPGASDAAWGARLRDGAVPATRARGVGLDGVRPRRCARRLRLRRSLSDRCEATAVAGIAGPETRKAFRTAAERRRLVASNSMFSDRIVSAPRRCVLGKLGPKFAHVN
jgi:hypothetical protein